MHVVVATDGSQQSLRAAKQLKSFADPTKITDISVVAVIRPLAAAQSSVEVVAAVFEGWGPKVHQRIRSGSPATEIIKACKQLNAGLVVVASGGRGISDTVLVGSTAQRVQHYAPCPVLVVRPAPRARKK